MLKPLIVIAGLALASTAPAFAEPSTNAPAVAKAAEPLTVDSPLHDLVADPRTRPVIARRMPGFIERFETDPELQQMLGDISPTGLQHDPHARGVTPEALAKLAAELAEAQKPAAS